jgi:hypothetical protein
LSSAAPWARAARRAKGREQWRRLLLLLRAEEEEDEGAAATAAATATAAVAAGPMMAWRARQGPYAAGRLLVLALHAARRMR